MTEAEIIRVAKLEARAEEQSKTIMSHDLLIAQNTREIRQILQHLEKQETAIKDFWVERWSEVEQVKAKVSILLYGGGTLGTCVAILQVVQFFLDLQGTGK